MASSFILCLNKLFFFHKEKAFHFHKTILKVLSMTLSGTSAWIEASIKICFIFEHFVLQLLCSGWRAAFIEMTGISIIWSAGQWDKAQGRGSPAAACPRWCYQVPGKARGFLHQGNSHTALRKTAPLTAWNVSMTA